MKVNCEMLLAQITAISEKYDLLYKKTGGYFNVFEVTGISHDEVTICRVLCELLSPAGSHYQGDAYLRLFFENVLHLPISDSELETARVFREYQIDEKRRIDIVIETSEKFVPIEVKIYARDQERQCFDYYKEAQKHTVDPKIYYLTRFGTDPSKNSANNLSETDIINISFNHDILDWLDLCLKWSNTLKVASIREIILQLMDVIRKFTDKMGDEKEMEIKELLLSSSDNIKSAIAIQSALSEAKEELMFKLFKAIQEKAGVSKLDNQYDFEHNNNQKIKTYYNRKSSTYPGISYLYKEKNMINSDKDIWVRIEIDEHLFVGYCCPVNGEATSETLSLEEIKTVLKVEPCTDNWWAYWEYVPGDNEIMCPNFRNHNEAYYRLFDRAGFDSFVEHCCARILSLLER